MTPSDRASLRHFLSAAMIFGESVDDKRDARTRALEAFDEWFALLDSHAQPSAVPPSHEWLRLNDPAKHAAWAAGNLEPSVVDWMAGWEACRAQVTAVSPAAGLAGALTSGEGASKPIAWAIPQTKQFSWDQQDERWWSPLYLRPHGVRAVPPTNERGVSDAS